MLCFRSAPRWIPCKTLGHRFRLRCSFIAAAPAELPKFYQPKVGDVVLGVVVSTNGGKLDIDIAAKKLGMMFNSNAIPLDTFSLQSMSWDISAEEQTPPIGRPLLPKYEEALQETNGTTTTIVEPGTVLQALVTGITLSGVPVLSTRDFARPLAWQRLREIYNTEEIIDVCVESYSAGGLICRVEGMLAFLPKDRIRSSLHFAQLRGYVGKRMPVLIIQVDESRKRLVVSEQAAWVRKLAPPNSLVQGVVIKLYTSAAVVQLDGVDISGLIDVSNISLKKVPDIKFIFSIGDRVKAVVAPSSRNPEQVMLNTAVLERDSGEMIDNKQNVFEQAEETFRLWREEMEQYVQRVSRVVHKEEMLEQGKDIANHEWLKL